MPPTTSIRRFQLPPGGEPDRIRPHTIKHGCDYMLREDGSLEFYYNFLDYIWEVDGSEVRARHYLDHRGKIAVMMPFEQFDQPKYADILTYLQRRFSEIETFESDGYVVRWRVAEPT
jgi:hypothetical protein